jgi:hypothetical protein
MALEQESKFELNLELGESYIYGTAFTSDNSYSINIQQASNNLIVLPSNFINIKESCEALVSFGLCGHSDRNKIFVRSEMKVGRGDLIEVIHPIKSPASGNDFAYNTVHIDVTELD